ncbi:uncharacterized protein LOC131659100 [Vicia villosa]|uniref:uncharacterized protein LOC131659100 n=1 Tax=Vicia villosa TaxID=3911 RepID=UPI00273C3025|nr:uncharacterized protein LOC131659100 [Vicia villosa]
MAPEKMQPQDPLEEIDLGKEGDKRPTFISANIDPELRSQVILLLKEFKDCFAWDYNEMPGLSRELVELKLPIQAGKKPVKQTPLRFAPAIMSKIKEEVERHLKIKFIRTARYVEWLANIVPVVKKNGKLRVCIDFRDLNATTPNDEYAMSIAEMLIDSAAAGDFLGFVVHKKGIEVNQSKTKAIMDIKPASTKKELQSLIGKVNFLRRFISNLSGKTKAFSPLLRLKNEDFIWKSQHQEAFDRIKEYLTKPPVLAPLVRSRPMRLYIAASESTIGSMLVQENDNGVERLLYYLSRMLNDPETRYSDIEKRCLCLYFSCMKLKQYIKPVDVYVSLHSDIIKHMLSKPIFHSRIGKWALALTEYSLTYAPLKAMKGQVVADFLVDHSMVEVPQNNVDLAPWKLYFDGSSHKNGTGIGGIIISLDGIPAEFKYSIAGTCTNNEAEYEALITGLELLLELGARNVEIMGESELVVKQVSKDYKCVKENLIMQENQEANDLAQEASEYKRGGDEEPVQVREKIRATVLSPSDLSVIKLGVVDAENFEIFTVDNGQENDWRKPLVAYLRNPTRSTDRKIKYKALSFVLLENEIFKKTSEGVLLKCLGDSKAYLAVSNVHSGACGAHQAGHKMKWTLMRSEVYWPSMLKDCIEFAKGCQECQMHGGIQHVPASELHAIVKSWPFRGWALDVIGEIKSASSKQ